MRSLTISLWLASLASKRGLTPAMDEWIGVDYVLLRQYQTPFPLATSAHFLCPFCVNTFSSVLFYATPNLRREYIELTSNLLNGVLNV